MYPNYLSIGTESYLETDIPKGCASKPFDEVREALIKCLRGGTTPNRERHYNQLYNHLLGNVVPAFEH